jgi:hypothetical protein
VLDGELFYEFGLLVDVIAHKRSVGYNTAPSTSRSAPSRSHTSSSA